MKEYSIKETWSSEGSPTLAYIKAPSATQAVVKYLISQGYRAREMLNGDLVTSDDAPSVLAHKVG